jgi:hypothetical protein
LKILRMRYSTLTEMGGCYEKESKISKKPKTICYREDI